MSLETLKIMYYAYFHSIMNYAIIGGGGGFPHSITISKLQKIIRITMDAELEIHVGNISRN
jgi:hypothetical protein